MPISERIISFREAAGLSQRELAKKAGLTSQAICQYESSKRVPDLKCFVSICRALGVRMDMFMNGVTM